MHEIDWNAALDTAAAFGPGPYLLAILLVVVGARGRQVFDGIGGMFKSILEGYAAVVIARTERKKIDRIYERENERLKNRKG